MVTTVSFHLRASQVSKYLCPLPLSIHSFGDARDRRASIADDRIERSTLFPLIINATPGTEPKLLPTTLEATRGGAAVVRRFEPPVVSG